MKSLENLLLPSDTRVQSRAKSLLLCLPLLALPLTSGVAVSARAQEPATESAQPAPRAVVPQQVRFAGKLAARSSESVEAVFKIYSAAEGGEPLWSETQQVSVAADGSYAVLLGASTATGLPQSVFSGGAARWLGVTVERGDEEQRVLLSSVPYAMKSADAELLAGHQATDFATQAQLAGLAQKVTKVEQSATPAFQPELTPSGSGTPGAVPLWATSSTLGNSTITQASGKIGINFSAPTVPLEVGGNMTVHGTLLFPPGFSATPTNSAQSQYFQFSASEWNSVTAAPVSSTYTLEAGPVGNNTANPNSIFYLIYQNGTAPATSLLTVNANGQLGLPNPAGGMLSNGNVLLAPVAYSTTSAAANSPMLEMGASTWLSTANAARAQTFAWQTQGTGNNTATPSGNLALLYGYNGATPAATGLSIAKNGQITFASGQIFPVTGTGGGTISGITSSSPLTGAGTSGSVALGLNESQLTTDITPALENTFSNLYVGLGTANTFTYPQTFQNITTVSGTNTQGSMLNVSNSGGAASTAINATNGGNYGTAITTEAGAGGFGLVSDGVQSAGSAGILAYLNGGSGLSGSYSLLEADDGLDAGVWADAPTGETSAVIATADNAYAGVFYNDSSIFPTITALNNSSGGSTGLADPAMATVIRAGGPGGICDINQSGNLACTGQVKTVMSTQGGARQLETYAVQSAENWVEDYGSGQLSHGSATIQVESAFAQIVNTGVEFHVFLTPGGDCKGLYVTNKTAGSFEVHELGGGKSNIPFDYKIVAKRTGMERQRLVDVTERMRAETEQVKFRALDRPLPRKPLGRSTQPVQSASGASGTKR